MSPCSALLLSPQTDICSGHGICDNHTLPTCICTEGWTSRGDFRYEEGLDCDVYYAAIRGLYSISLIGMIVALIFCVSNLRTLVLAREGNKNRSSGPILIHQLIFCGTIFHIIFDILKVVDPVYYCIGLEPISTWIIMIAFLFIFICIYQISSGMLALSLEQTRFTERKSTKSLLLVLRVFLPGMLLTICVCLVLATVGGFYHPDLGLTFLFVTIISSAICFTLAAGLMPIALGHILVDMHYLLNHDRTSDSNASPTLERVYKRLRNLRAQFTLQCMANAVMGFIVAFWPFLIRKT